MPSIINGLFAGRSGISSHGAAIAVVGDNISNASTIGYKAARAEFEDLVAGGQAAGRVVGSGSSVSAISASFEQGTLEFTGKSLDLAVDGNGFFVVATGEQRFYTRAGNFKTDSAGYIVDQNGNAVLGFPGGNGTGDLQPLNVNTVSQSSVATTQIEISGNVNASSTPIPVATVPAAATTTYSDLNSMADSSTVVNVFDALGAKHTVTLFYFNTSTVGTPRQYTVKAYANKEEVLGGGTAGLPSLLGTTTLTFGTDGARSPALAAGANDMSPIVAWSNGAASSTIDFRFDPYTQYSASSNILSINQDGQGIGTVTSVEIKKDGQIFALLSNGQSAVIGTVGLVNFSNPEGLSRIGNNLLQQSGSSGEPIIGKPQTGTLGDISAGSLELSTVDIANEFVKLITLQRGFQASSRMITTINQLLNEIIQLA